jgi:hypothetical protein
MTVKDAILQEMGKFLDEPPANGYGRLTCTVIYHAGKPVRVVTGRKESQQFATPKTHHVTRRVQRTVLQEKGESND